MSEPNEIPPELQHLIEKREREEDRRQSGGELAEQPKVDPADAEAESHRSNERRIGSRRKTDS